MATTETIGGDGELFVGEDKTIRMSIPSVDMTGWSVLLDVRKSDKSPPPAIFSKTATITGSYNVDPLLSTQKAVVVLTDTELNTVTGRTYRHSWKRMDDGSETVLSRGPFIVEKATAP
jgi:hypothetical protein